MFYLNDTPLPLTASTVAELADQQAWPLQGIAVSVNQQVVPRRHWSELVIKPHDRLHVFHIVAGG